MEKKKSPGIDRISVKMTQKMGLLMFCRLIRIIQNIIKLRYFPRQWKIAVISPIPKPGKDGNHVTGYRPISLLPILSKITEKVILDNIN
ncbi:putative RNA-directed DNA polymerase from transposon X-element, partial [Stegodyphus mimosarum]